MSNPLICATRLVMAANTCVTGSVGVLLSLNVTLIALCAHSSACLHFERAHIRMEELSAL